MLLFSMAIGLLGLAGMASADTITLKSGRVIQGTYLGGTARQVRVDTGDQIQTLNVTDVSRIEFSRSAPAPEAKLKEPAAALNTPTATTQMPNTSNAVATPTDASSHTTSVFPSQWPTGLPM